MAKVKEVCSAVLLFAVVCFVCGCQSIPKENLYPKDDVREYDKIKQGKYDNVVCVPMKDFIVKGMIFVESQVTIDVNGEKTGSEITNQMLMKAAQKLGADDVINVKIDEIEDHKIIDNYSKKDQTIGTKHFEKGEFVKREYKQYNYIYQATGLAIKYTNAIVCDKILPLPKVNEDRKVELTSKENLPFEKQIVKKSKNKKK